MGEIWENINMTKVSQIKKQNISNDFMQFIYFFLKFFSLDSEYTCEKRIRAESQPQYEGRKMKC